MQTYLGRIGERKREGDRWEEKGRSVQLRRETPEWQVMGSGFWV